MEPSGPSYIDAREPFGRLINGDITKITNYHKISNAIAHKSENSLENFNSIIATLPLLPSEKAPTDYLRSKPHVGGQTQFEITAIELKSITNILCVYTNTIANN